MKKFLAAALAVLAMVSCRKDAEKMTRETDDTITPIGTPVGQAVHKTIDANGGEITSPDGTLKITIPAGALSNATDISIQAISNQLTGGIGNAYRLLPHGQIFAKAVTLAFNYKDADTTGSRPECLDIAFQNAEGTWEMLTNTAVNRAQRKISATTTHFSDWGYFKSIYIEPGKPTVKQGDFLELKVMTTFPRIDPDDAPPGTYTIKVLKKPRKLRDDEIKRWDYAGEGKLDPEGASAFYTAPDHDPNVNPEAAVANINMHRKGQFMIFANITVIGNTNIDYLWVDEDYFKFGSTADPVMYLYGDFGADPGVGKRSVKINSTEVQVTLWSPKIIRCTINEFIFGPIEIAANNKIIARSVLRKFKGKFLYERFHGGLLNSGSSNALKESTEFTFVFRGFGKPCPSNVDLLFPKQGSLAFGTEAKYSLSGSASVSTPVVNGCVYTTSVSLPTSTGLQFLEPLSLPGVPGMSEFKVEAEEVDGGIDIKVIDYVIENVVTNVKVQRSSSCGPSSFDPPKSLQCGFEGFKNQVIHLSYWNTDELTLKGTNKLVSNRMSSNILIEAWDNTVSNPSHYQTDGLVPATLTSLP